MIRWYLPLLTLFCASALHAQSTPKKTLQAVELEDEARIDGDLSEDVWARAAVITELAQYFPEPAAAPEGIDSKIYLYYTQRGLYIGAEFVDKLDDIKHQIIERDQGNGNTDWVQFIVNPFNDGANDFNFYLSASGQQGDSRMTFDGEDAGWNAVWESAVQLKEDRWVVELFIPYRELRIPQTLEGQEPKPWGFNVKRSRRSDRTLYSWNPIDRNFDNESLQSGLLTGVAVRNPPLRVSLRPNLTAAHQRSASGTTGENLTAGADIKIGLNKSFTLDMTLLPDFSQVAYDQQFVNFEPFEQRFDENRQFFKEGVNLFNKANLFYSRRIGGNPKNFTNANLDDLSNTTQSFTRMLNATKLTGTTDGNLSVGVLNALTAANYAQGTDSLGLPVDVLTEPLTNYNVVAFDQRIGGNSSVGLINTHVLRANTLGPTRDAITTALTGNLNFLSNSHYWNATAARSTIYDIDQPYSGETLEWELGKQTGAWRYEHELQLTTPDFDPNDMGFQRRANRFHQEFEISHQLLQPKGNYLRRRNRVEILYRRLYEPSEFERFHVAYSHFGLLKNFFAYGYDLELRPDEVDFFDARVWGRYRINPSSMWHNVWFSTDYRKPVAMDLRAGYWAWSDYDAGGFYGNAKLLLRPSNALNFEANFDANRFNQVGWAQTLSTDSIGMAVRTNRSVTQSLSGSYLFGPNSYLRLDVRHIWNRFDPVQTFHLNEDGTLKPSNAYEDPTLRINIFNLDLKYVLWFAPGREMNLLYRTSLAHADDETQLNYWRNIQRTSTLPSDHLVSLRIVYFLDYADLMKSAKLRS